MEIHSLLLQDVHPGLHSFYIWPLYLLSNISILQYRNGINAGPEGFTVSHTVKIANNRVLGDWDYPLTTEGMGSII